MGAYLANLNPVQTASTLQVADVILRTKQRADIEKSGSTGVVSDAEILSLVNTGARMLDDLITKSYEDYRAEYWCFPTVARQIMYTLPGNFYKLRRIGVVDQLGSTPNTWTPLYPFDLNQNNLPGTGFFFFTNGAYPSMAYRLTDRMLELRPCTSVQNIGVWYTPQPPVFKSPQDYLPSYYMPGWEEYIVCWAAMMISAKRQMANVVAEQMWEEIKQQIASFVPNRDSANPAMVQQSWVPPSMWPGYGGPYGGGYGSW